MQQKVCTNCNALLSGAGMFCWQCGCQWQDGAGFNQQQSAQVPPPNFAYPHANYAHAMQYPQYHQNQPMAIAAHGEPLKTTPQTVFAVVNMVICLFVGNFVSLVLAIIAVVYSSGAATMPDGVSRLRIAKVLNIIALVITLMMVALFVTLIVIFINILFGPVHIYY